MAHAGDIVMPSHSGPAMVNIYKQNQLDGNEQPQPQARHNFASFAAMLPRLTVS